MNPKSFPGLTTFAAAAPRAPDELGGAGDMSFLDDASIYDAPAPASVIEPEDDDLDLDGDGEPAVSGEQQGQQQQAPLTVDELTRRNADLQAALRRERSIRRQGAISGAPQQQAAPAQQGGQQGAAPAGHGREGVDDFVDPDRDPMGSIQQMQRLIRDFQAAEATRTQSAQAEREQSARYERIDNAFREDEAEFRRDTPDFDQAAGHYLRARAQELGVYGFNQPQIEQGLKMELRRLTASAVARGESPAALLYGLATSRGYKKAAAADPANPGQQQQADPAKKPGTNTALDRIRQGAQAQSPMSRTGAGGGKEIDPATIAKIDIHSKKGGEAFDKAWDQFARTSRARERAGR